MKITALDICYQYYGWRFKKLCLHEEVMENYV